MQTQTNTKEETADINRFTVKLCVACKRSVKFKEQLASPKRRQRKRSAERLTKVPKTNQ